VLVLVLYFSYRGFKFVSIIVLTTRPRIVAAASGSVGRYFPVFTDLNDTSDFA